jgi:hypothetical protein
MTEQDLIDLGFKKDISPHSDIYNYTLNVYNGSDGVSTLHTYYNDLIHDDNDWFVMFHVTTNYKMYDKEDVILLLDFMKRTYYKNSHRNWKLKNILNDRTGY